MICRSVESCVLYLNRTVRRYDDTRRVRRHRNVRLQQITVRRRAQHDLPGRVDIEVARPRVIEIAVRIIDLEKPFAFDCQVQRFVRRLECTLLVVRLSARNARTQTDFDTRCRQVAVRILRTRQAVLAIEDVFEVGPVLLESRRVDIRHIIGDHVELRLEGLHARRGCVECLNCHG